ncbi:MAG: RnfABCDGE type electron transport complex subunit A [Pirellulaceae bacterium]|nr:RnfABCDGE type electron transport complex subunit A [Pirellulaceae bacterium]
MGELLLIALSAAVINNLVLTYFLGICPFLGVSRRLDMAFGMGAAVTFVMTVAGVMTFAAHKYVLLPLGLAFLQYIVFIFIIAATVQLVEMYVRKMFPPLYEAFGVFLPMITTNCAILGTCLFIWLKGYTRLSEALVFSFSGGVGFTLAIVIMAGMREELELADVPRPLRGAAITLFIAAILAMAFSGFAGIGR